MIPAVRKSFVVPISPDTAFRRFTNEIASWWPLETHSVGGALTRTCVFDATVGGLIHEVAADGTISAWGTITQWDPPGRVCFSWHPGRGEATAQDVEVCFTETDEGTRIDLCHDGWDRYGPDGPEARDAYDEGWDAVLAPYRLACAGEPTA